MIDEISEPTREWEYRNFLCRLYRLGDIKVLGYVRIGDEWKEVIETEDMTTDVDRVEDEVDTIIQDALSDDDSWDYPIGDPVDPLPDIDPNPIDPNPNPDRPWDRGPYYGPPDWEPVHIPHIHLSGSANIKTTDGSSITTGLGEIDPDSITDGGLLDE